MKTMPLRTTKFDPDDHFVRFHLWGKPVWEIENLESEEVTRSKADEIREAAKRISVRAWNAADAIQDLLAKGWKAYGVMYDVEMSPPGGMETLGEIEDALRDAHLLEKAELSWRDWTEVATAADPMTYSEPGTGDDDD